MKLVQLTLLLFLGVVQLQQEGCNKEDHLTIEELTADVYDLYIIDTPFSRDLYQKKAIKTRKMMEVSTVDLPAEEGYIVRSDSFSTNGRLIKTAFFLEDSKDSIRYEYKASGQIEKVHSYQQKTDSTSVHYYYDEYGMLSQVIFYRDQVTGYEFDHNKYGKLTDMRLSDESPSYSPVREIYRYNSMGKMVQALTLTNNSITARHKRYYDKKWRISKTEELANGIVMSSTTFLYNNEGLLSMKKDWFRVSEDEEVEKVYEYLYGYY